MKDSDPSEPIAEERRQYRPKYKVKKRDKFEGFREKDQDEDYVPEPPTY